MKCISDCGCAGGQNADTCTFDPSCHRCRNNDANRILNRIHDEMVRNSNWQEIARRDIDEFNRRRLGHV